MKYTCVFDSCDDGGTYLAATCDGRTWSVASRICGALGCRGGEDDFGCPVGDACVATPTCPEGGRRDCAPNPCSTAPFSCECAQAACPGTSVCESAVAGVITCKEAPRLPTDPSILADGLGLTGPVALFGRTLYVAVSSPSPIIAIDVDTSVQVAVGTGGQAYDVAVDSSGVYWSEYAGIRTVRGDGTTTSLVDGSIVGHLALGATHVYFVTGGGDAQHPNRIGRVAKTGGAPEYLIATASSIGMAVDSSAVYFSDRGTGSGDGAVYSIPLGGGSSVTLAGQQPLPGAVAIDATHVVWIDDSIPSVNVMPRSGGAPTVLYTGTAGLTSTRAVAIDGTTVYFTDGTARMVAKVPIAGGAVTPIATEQQPQPGIAVDDRYVYWPGQCGRVFKAPK